MLARNFLSAQELGLSEIEVESLIKVLNMFERGEIEYYDCKSFPVPPGKYVNMSFFSSNRDETNECGTIGCICGWANMISNGVAFDNINDGKSYPSALNDLYLGGYGLFNLPKENRLEIPKDHIIRALSNYLTTGSAKWNEIRSAA